MQRYGYARIRVAGAMMRARARVPSGWRPCTPPRRAPGTPVAVETANRLWTPPPRVLPRRQFSADRFFFFFSPHRSFFSHISHVAAGTRTPGRVRPGPITGFTRSNRSSCSCRWAALPRRHHRAASYASVMYYYIMQPPRLQSRVSRRREKSSRVFENDISPLLIHDNVTSLSYLFCVICDCAMVVYFIQIGIT